MILDSIIQPFLNILGKVLMFLSVFVWTVIFKLHELLLFIADAQADLALTVFLAVWENLLLFAVILAARTVLAIVMSRVAKIKGYKTLPYFTICFLLGTVGCVVILCLPDLEERRLKDITDDAIRNRTQA